MTTWKWSWVLALGTIWLRIGAVQNLADKLLFIGHRQWRWRYSSTFRPPRNRAGIFKEVNTLSAAATNCYLHLHLYCVSESSMKLSWDLLQVT
jgi:hypothetical protein